MISTKSVRVLLLSIRHATLSLFGKSKVLNTVCQHSIYEDLNGTFEDLPT